MAAASTEDLFKDPGWRDPVLPHGVQGPMGSSVPGIQGAQKWNIP